MAPNRNRRIDPKLTSQKPVFAIEDRLQQILDALHKLEPECDKPEHRLALYAKMLAVVQAAERALDRLHEHRRLEQFVNDLAQIVAGCSAKARREVMSAIEERFALEHPPE